ncbi:MAG: CatB-related O-acetyltransferase [Quinella sp. 3Q1]|nr:CatB-related O-acetyltransferase [Quinella sp. 3Q1]MBR6886838.1 CatB-related O-acetyltransferase [Selenomonadaceae bacterium]
MNLKLSVGADKITDTDKNFFDKNKDVVLTLGAYSYINSLDLWVGGRKSNGHVLIGRFCSLSWNLTFLVARNHNYKALTTYSKFNRSNIASKNPHQIIIGHDVWIGHGVMILGGVKIGNGAIIGAGAVVAKDIPPYAIAVGNPVRVIKYRFDEQTIKKLLAVKWWNWDKEKVEQILPASLDMEKFLAEYYSPELRNFPEDDFSRQIDNFGGKNFYHFIPDFQARSPLWSKVIREFHQANLEDALLVIWLDKNTAAAEEEALVKAIDSNKNILVFKHAAKFSPLALRRGTHFITTREMTTLEALDYLWDTDVKIISALDDKIFGG